MADIEDGGSVEVKGSAAQPYVLRNVGGVYSCTCPAWAHQSLPLEKRTCKHLRALRGAAAEAERTQGAVPPPRSPKSEREAEARERAKEKAPPLLLAHTWETHVDLTGWWMSEKLDGVRAYWDGESFISRLGNRYHAPPWFTEGLPKEPLDGELWCGRKKFQRCVSIVRRQDHSKEWAEIQYLVFDAPDAAGGFETRLEHIQGLLSERRLEYAAHHQHEQCRGAEHLREELARVESLGGEGLMMRRPGSKYEVGRSSTLLKVKSFHDAEARVVDHLPGTGKHKGRLGAVLVEMPGGTRFSVGTGFSDAEREDPPAVGSIITYRFQELSEGGVPRFPSYVGVRHDFDWEAATKDAGAAAARPVAKGVAAKSAAKERAALAEKPAAKPAPVSSSGDASINPGERRRLELASKFWEVEVSDNRHVVTFGKVGSPGQKRLKVFKTPGEAAADATKLIGEKLRKGYELR